MSERTERGARSYQGTSIGGRRSGDEEPSDDTPYGLRAMMTAGGNQAMVQMAADPMCEVRDCELSASREPAPDHCRFGDADRADFAEDGKLALVHCGVIEQARSAAIRAAEVQLHGAVQEHLKVVSREVRFGVVRFAGATGGNASLSLTATEWQGLLDGGASKAGAGTEAAAYSAKKLANRAGVEAVKAGVRAGAQSSVANLAAVAKWASRGLGAFVVGTLASMFFDFVLKTLFGAPSADEIASDAHEQMAGLANELCDLVDAEKDSKLGELYADIESLVAWAEGTHDTVEPLLQLAGWCEAQAEALVATPPPTEEGIYLDLLERWVLEHAGDEEDPASDTSEKSWRDAAAHLDEKQRGENSHGVGRHGYEREDGNITKRNLYEDQCRREWTQMGLDPTPAVAELRARVASFSSRGPFIPGHESHLGQGSYVFREALDDKVFEAMTRQEFGRTRSLDPNDSVVPLEFMVSVLLNIEDGTIFVDEFRYKIRGEDDRFVVSGITEFSRSPE